MLLYVGWQVPVGEKQIHVGLQMTLPKMRPWMTLPEAFIKWKLVYLDWYFNYFFFVDGPIKDMPAMAQIMAWFRKKVTSVIYSNANLVYGRLYAPLGRRNELIGTQLLQYTMQNTFLPFKLLCEHCIYTIGSGSAKPI